MVDDAAADSGGETDEQGTGVDGGSEGDESETEDGRAFVASDDVIQHERTKRGRGSEDGGGSGGGGGGDRSSTPHSRINRTNVAGNKTAA